ncbi:unnamed protein product [Rotaria sp. Silwood2]|nr:unnamed protein product [Rotaria sp. Silwood2]CAF4306372.1 unnamed protein product [Rotaria sp. Silwood2]
MRNFRTIVTISNGQTTTFVDKSSLVNGETYEYRIVTFDSLLKSPFSSVVSAIPQLTAPASFKAIAGEESASVVISWSPVTNATGYEIQRRSAINNTRNFSAIATISNGQTTTFVDKSGLVTGKTYNYRIVAFDSRLKSAFSSVVSAVPQLTAPANFKAITGKESASIVLSWSPVTNATGYEIQRRSAINNTRNFSAIASISNDQTTTFVDESGLVNGNTYNYRIAAFDTGVISAFSSIIQGTAHIRPPEKLLARQIRSSHAVLLSWTPVKEGTGYNIKRSAEDGTGSPKTITTILDSNVDEYLDQSLGDNCKYCYTITSKDITDESIYESRVAISIAFVNVAVSLKEFSGRDNDKSVGLTYT